MRGEPWTGSNWKPETKVVDKVTKRRKVAAMDRSEKEKVRKRDNESCRVCGGPTRDVHERLFKSLGGVASLENSMCACRRICHTLLQQHGIKVYGWNCNDPLSFGMSEAAAVLVFGSRPLPNHVTIEEVGDRLGEP